jgi:hypothetical protein
VTDKSEARAVEQPKLTPEHASEHIHSAQVGTTAMIHPSVMDHARRRGWVIDMPGTSGGLLTRAHYVQALQEFSEEHPEVLATIEQQRAVRSTVGGMQGRIDAERDATRRRLGYRGPKP